MMIPRIVDTSRYEEIEPDGFKKAKEAGLWGMITKSTEGTTYRDKTFPDYIKQSRDAGLLVGAYHFAEGHNPIEEANFFLEAVNPPKDMLMALDYENYKSQMTPEGMFKFLKRIEEKLGRKAVIYSGNLLKETITDLSAEQQAYVCAHKLWLAHYSSTPTVPKGFKSAWLHQYSGDGVGPEPHWIPGIKAPGNKGLDLNAYAGTFEQLKKEWAAIEEVKAPIVVPVDPHKDHSLLKEVEEWFGHMTKSWVAPWS